MRWNTKNKFHKIRQIYQERIVQKELMNLRVGFSFISKNDTHFYIIEIIFQKIGIQSTPIKFLLTGNYSNKFWNCEPSHTSHRMNQA